MSNVKISVLMASHNRRNMTLRSLQSLIDNQAPRSTEVRVFLLDDASTDGTAIAIRDGFPAVTVVTGSGSLYWSGGMRAAFDMATRDDPDFYLWLNDDTVLDRDCLARLYDTYQELSRSRRITPIIVGTVRDPESGEPTYGGVLMYGGWNPLRHRLAQPHTVPRRVDTFHGNCVLIPREVVAQIGHIDRSFTHGIGDFDFGLRAKAAGFSAWVAPGTVGACARNPEPRAESGIIANVFAPIIRMINVKDQPPRETFVYVRRHGGRFWLLIWIGVYIKALVAGIVQIWR